MSEVFDLENGKGTQVPPCQCGAENLADATFCTACGERLPKEPRTLYRGRHLRPD